MGNIGSIIIGLAPKQVTVSLDHGELVIIRWPRQRWIDICWQLLGMQRDIAQRQVHDPGIGKVR
jgi:hypothetical protein